MPDAPGRSSLNDSRSLDEESARSTVLSVPYETILAISDLHLGPGRDEITDTFPITENFLLDEPFARFLEYHAPKAEAPALLIFNGDTFDFLRITRTVAGPNDRAAWLTRLERLNAQDRIVESDVPTRGGERTFGLQTHDYKSVWKLHVIIEGHRVFFRALARWLERGGRLLFVVGNHDLELHWPLVRAALRDEFASLAEFGAPIESAVAFADRSFVLANLYVEHGHQYESMTRVLGPAVLERRPTELNLPLGSFVNRYFINRIERLDPYIDNRKPVGQALMALLRQRPITVFRIYSGGWKFLLRALGHATTRYGILAILLVLALFTPILTALAVALWMLFPGLREAATSVFPNLSSANVRAGGIVGGLSLPAVLPYVFGAMRDIARDLGFRRSHDALVKGASQRLAESFPNEDQPRRIYAVMGHTHLQLTVRLDRRGGEAYYLNTGAWVPRWPADRPDLAGRTVLTFARFQRAAHGEYRHEMLEWCEEAGGPRRATIVVVPSEEHS